MIQYPSIDGPGARGDRVPNLPCMAFEKLDGSNLRWEFNRKRGWEKFGSRHRLVGSDDLILYPANSKFLDKYGSELEQVFRSTREYRNMETLTVFCEFWGPNSFAGQHDPQDYKDVTLFDIHGYKRGLLPPREFVDNFGHLEIPKLVYEGNSNQEFVNAVMSGEYPVVEGVVCKGVNNGRLWMCKIKTGAWLTRLKGKYGADWERYV